MLKDLREDIEIKFNITDNEFDSFMRRAAVAMTTGDEKDWNFWNSLDFVFTAITTIGKVIEIIQNRWRTGCFFASVRDYQNGNCFAEVR